MSDSNYARNICTNNYCTTVLNSIQELIPKSKEEIALETGLPITTVVDVLEFITDIGLPLIWAGDDIVRLYRRIIPLDVVYIRKIVSENDLSTSNLIEVYDTVDSTNEFLLARCGSQSIHKQVCIAEHMSHGRGRQNKKWFTGAFENIMMSVGWCHDSDIRKISGLSLAVSVMVVRVLSRFTRKTFQVKWPNDVLCEGGKLCGILVEIRESSIIVGVGVNCQLSEPEINAIEQPVVGLNNFFDVAPLRSELIASLIIELYKGLDVFSNEGLKPFKEEWTHLHANQGKRMRLNGSPSREGVAVGINDDGAILLRSIDDGILPIYAGEVVPVD